MKMFRFTLGWEQLDAVPEDERVLALMLGKVLNDVNILSNLLSCVPVDRPGLEVELHGRAAQLLLLATTLAGKLLGAWDLLHRRYFGAKLSAQYHPVLGNDGVTALNTLKSYFSQENPLRTIRKMHAFHYDASLVKADYPNVPRQEPTDIYLSSLPTCNLFQVSESVTSSALLRKIGAGDTSKGIEILVLDTARISGVFQAFAGSYMTAFIGRHWPQAPPHTEIDLGTVAVMKSISIPFLMEP